MNGTDRRHLVLLHDVLMAALAYAAAYVVRYNFDLGGKEWTGLVQSLPLAVLVQGLVLWRSGLPRRVWRFTSVGDLVDIVRAAVLGVLTLSAALFLVNRLHAVPRTSLAIMYPMFLIGLLGAPRLLFRLWTEHSLRPIAGAMQEKVLLLGAGRAGEALARDMLRQGRYLPVGFLDDRAALRGARIHGVPVLGNLDQLQQVAGASEAETLVIAAPSASNSEMQRMVRLCEATGLPFRTLPRLDDLVSGQVNINALREVAIEDLLGREPVSLDWEAIRDGLQGKIVMVTGGGGSIGSELCRQIARLGPARLAVVDNSEFNLYRAEAELRRSFPQLELLACLADVGDALAVDYWMRQTRPQVVFHAAAYKHVPMLQSLVRAAVQNNVLGTRTVALAASEHGCETFVLISTDKAVRPTNIMGASKRVAELLVQLMKGRSATRFVVVRFGNVLGSAGSVVPLFQEQIARGGPVTVTHPAITRFFMTIPEACQLIMQAAVMGRGGEIYVLEMGAPVRIAYLAEQMIRLSGRSPGVDVKIVYTGLRPGEKLHEELFYDAERLAPTTHPMIHQALPQALDEALVARGLEEADQACAQFDAAALRRVLRRLVPDFQEGDAPSISIVQAEVV